MKGQSFLHMNLSNFFVNIFKPCTCVEERLLTMKSVCQETCLYRDCRRQAPTSVKSTESCLWGREKRKISQWTQTSEIWLDWLASEPLGVSSQPSRAGFTDVQDHGRFLCCCLSEISKQIIPWDIYSVSKLLSDTYQNTHTPQEISVFS